MFPVVLYRELPNFTIAPLVVASLVAASAIYSTALNPSFRKPIPYSACIAAICQLLCTVLVFVDLGTMSTWTQLTIPLFYSLRPVYHLFYAIHVSFMFMPGLIAFYRIARGQDRKNGVINNYFGYVWTALVTVMGVALTILIATTLPKDDVEYTGGAIEASFIRQVSLKISVLYRLYSFIYFSNWALVAACLNNHVIQFRVMKGKGRNSLIANSALNIIAVIFNTALHNTGRNTDAVAVMVVIFVFVNMTSGAAIIIAVQYGHLWEVHEDIDADEENRLHSSTPVSSIPVSSVPASSTPVSPPPTAPLPAVPTSALSVPLVPTPASATPAATTPALAVPLVPTQAATVPAATVPAPSMISTIAH